MSDLVVVLLGGGTSSRFYPLKEKSLYKFNGVPMLKHIINKVKLIEPKKIILVVNENNRQDLSKVAGNECEVVVQKGEGMAGATSTAISTLGEDSKLLVTNTDDVMDDQIYKKMADYLRQLNEKEECVLVGYKTKVYFPGAYLEVKDGQIVNTIEKPGEGNEPSDLVKPVFDYFYSSDLFSKYLTEAKSTEDDLYEVALANMMQDGVVFKPMEYSGGWETVKYPWHVIWMMNYFLEGLKDKGQKIAKDVFVANTATIKGDVVIESGCKIYDGAVINGPVYIDKNTVVGNNSLVRDSMVGSDCVIGYSSEVARSYLGDSVWLHKNYVGDSVVENNVSFGSNAITANLRLDEQEVKVDIKGKEIGTGTNKFGAIIGSNVRVGVGAMIMPGIKVGAGSFVSSGVVLNQDVEEGKFIYTKNEYIVKDNKVDISAIDRAGFKKKL